MLTYLPDCLHAACLCLSFLVFLLSDVHRPVPCRLERGKRVESSFVEEAYTRVCLWRVDGAS